MVHGCVLLMHGTLIFLRQNNLSASQPCFVSVKNKTPRCVCPRIGTNIMMMDDGKRLCTLGLHVPMYIRINANA